MSRRLVVLLLCGVCATIAACSWQARRPRRRSFPKRPACRAPGVQHDIAELVPVATFAVQGHPDWMAVTDDAVWVTSSSANHVVRLDAKTNQPGVIVTVAKPCAGLALGFGSLWIPSCGDHTVVRVDPETGAAQATVAAGPADSEGGIADRRRQRVDRDLQGQRSGAHRSGDQQRSSRTFAFRPDRSIQSSLTTPSGSARSRRNAGAREPCDQHRGRRNTGRAYAALSYRGRGSIWVLNQGDGTIARVDATTGKRTAVIAAGIPGLGGEIAFGGGAVWARSSNFPITRIDPATNQSPGNGMARAATASATATARSGSQLDGRQGLAAAGPGADSIAASILRSANHRAMFTHRIAMPWPYK